MSLAFLMICYAGNPAAFRSVSVLVYNSHVCTIQSAKNIKNINKNKKIIVQ